MKNLLAENMLRFGVKNLTESQISKIQLLIEQEVLNDRLTVPDWVMSLHDLLKEKSSVYALAVSDAKKELGKFKIQFTVCTYDQYIAMVYLVDIEGRKSTKQGGTRGKWKILGGVNVAKNYDKWLQQIGEKSGDWWNTFVEKHISGGYNPKLEVIGKPVALRAQGDGKVLTYGVFSPTAISNDQQPGLASNFQDVILYINNASIMTSFNQEGTAGYWPYSIDIAATKQGFDYSKISENGGTSDGADFVTNIRFEGGGGEQYDETFVVTQKDGSVDVNLDGNSFEVNKTNLKPGAIEPAIKEIKSAIEKGAEIVSMTIESSASANEKTNPNPKTPGIDPTTGLPDGQSGPYIPKNENESRNAQLAFGRGRVVADALKAAGITVQPTINPIIQAGDPPIKARYAKISMQIMIKGKPATVDISKKLFTKAGGSSLGAGVIQGVKAAI